MYNDAYSQKLSSQLSKNDMGQSKGGVAPEESTNAEGGAPSGEENPTGEVNMNARLSYIPVPVAHVLRDCKRFLVDAKDIIVGDIVILDSKVSGIIPADIILFETVESEEFVISNYAESFDPANKHLFSFRNNAAEVLETASKKFAKLPAEGTPPEDGAPEPDCILDSPRFVPMGSRLFSGIGKGICIRIGNKTVKGLLR